MEGEHFIYGPPRGDAQVPGPIVDLEADAMPAGALIIGWEKQVFAYVPAQIAAIRFVVDEPPGAEGAD